jgi:RNA polymerase sigma factor (sigma-70 family)
MDNRQTDTALRDIDALFRLGVVAELSDWQLLERFAARCDAEAQIAFEAIVRRHGPMVLGVCRRALDDYHAAEDAFQATFLVLALRARAINKRESLGPWLHGVAARISRRALTLYRRRREEPIPSHGLSDTAAPDPDLGERTAVLDEELCRLPQKYRLPVVLCYLEGQTQEQAARTLGWTKGTVSGRLARAKDLLRHRLIRRGIAPSAGLLAVALAPQTVSAALPSSLLTTAVRSATAAILSGAGAGAGPVSGPAASLARGLLKAMFMGRLGKTAAQVLLLGLGAAALAAPLLGGRGPSAAPNRAGRPPAAARAAHRPEPDSRALRVDRYGDPLPWPAELRLGTTQRRHTTGVIGVGFSADGGAAVSAQQDGLVRYFDIKSGKQVRTIDLMATHATRDKSLRSFALSRDGSLLAGAGFAFDPARRLLAHNVWIWDLKQDRLLRTIEVKTLDLYCLAFSPDGTSIATGGAAGDVQIWDVATGESFSTLKLGDDSVWALVFAPDGRTVASSAQARGIRLWDLELGEATLFADTATAASAPCFSADGRLMAYARLGGEAVLYERATGQQRSIAGGAPAAFAPDGRSLALDGLEDGTIKVIDTGTGTVLWKTDLGWGLRAGGLAFSPGGETIAAERGGVLRSFEAATGRELMGVPDAHQGGVSVVRYTPDGHIVVTAGDDGTVRIWDAADARQLRVIPHGGRVRCLAVSPDGRKIATATESPGNRVFIWDLATGRPRQKWSGAGASTTVEGLDFSADGTLLLTYDREHVLKVRELATGRERPAVQPRFSLPRDNVFDSVIAHCSFGAGNKLLALGTMLTAHVTELATGEERFAAPSQALAFAPNGRTLAVATPGEPEQIKLADGRSRFLGNVASGIDLVDTGSGKRRRLAIPSDFVHSIAFSPDGKVLAVDQGWHGLKVRLYRIEDGDEVQEIVGPAKITHPGGLAFAPDGRSLAAGLDDTTVLIWNLRK